MTILYNHTVKTKLLRETYSVINHMLVALNAVNP
jgi:hypothetical protein